MVSFLDGSGYVSIVGNLAEWREFIEKVRDLTLSGQLDEKVLLEKADSVRLN